MDVRSLKDDAAQLFRKGKFAKAAEKYLALTKADPKDAQHLLKLGDSYRRDGKRDLAVDAYRRAVDQYAKQGIIIKAIAACKLVLEMDPNQKDAQEALATLCAKRYVRRDETPPPPPPKPAPTAGRYDPVELPEDDTVVAIETSGGQVVETAPPAPQPIAPPPAQPIAPPPPPARAPEPEPIELIDIDLTEGAPAQPVVAAPAPAPEPAEIELDIDLGPSAPEPRQDVYDLSAEAEALEELEEVEILEPILVAETTEQHRIMRDADEAAAQAATPMADILSDSLLIEGEADDGEEIELLSITTGESDLPAPQPPPPPEPTAPPEVDFLTPLPEEPAEDLAAKEAARLEAERREMMRVANEASFDLATPLPTVPDEPDLEPEPEVKPPPPPPDVPAEVEQKDVPLFSELPREAFLEMLEKLDFRRVDEGDVILREGDQGKSIFVLASGRAKVVKSHGRPEAIELATLEDGSFFGEMALLNGAPRVASVVALEDCEVLELTEELLRDLTRKHPAIAASLKKFYRQRLLSNVMAISPLFRAFDRSDRKMLVERFKLREFKPNEPVIKEGEKPDGLYVVMHGAALVAKKVGDGGRSVPLAVLKEGDVFGEMSLLSRKPASATVTAKRRTLVLRLPKSDFDELMFTHPSVLEVVSELTDQRTKVNERILKGEADAPREALALL